MAEGLSSLRAGAQEAWGKMQLLPPPQGVMPRPCGVKGHSRGTQKFLPRAAVSMVSEAGLEESFPFFGLRIFHLLSGGERARSEEWHR